MSSISPAIALLRLFVRPRAKRLPNGEKAIGVCLFLRLLVLLPAVLVGLLAWDKRDAMPSNERFDLKGYLPIIALGIVYVTGVLWVWWQRLVWTEEWLGVRPLFRKMKRYGWEDLQSVTGTRSSWIVRLEDGRKFRGNDWTTGGPEFLTVVAEKKGYIPAV